MPASSLLRETPFLVTLSQGLNRLERMFEEAERPQLDQTRETSPQAETPACSCEVAASWAAFTYGLQGVEARIQPLAADPQSDTACSGQAVVLPHLNRVECVLGTSADFSNAHKRLAVLADNGWAVWALVPLARLGQAHTAFWGAAEFVQGWWQRDENEVAFTQPEVP